MGAKVPFLQRRRHRAAAPMTAPEVLRSLVVPRYRGQLEGQAERPTRSAAGLLSRLIGEEKFQQRMEVLRQIPGIESVKNCFQSLLSPRYKPYGVAVRIVAEEPLPKLAESLRGGEEDAFNPLSSDGARIRISYTLDGKPMEEDIFCVVSKVVTQTGSRLSAQENIFWTAEALYAFPPRRGISTPSVRRAWRRSNPSRSIRNGSRPVAPRVREY